MEKSPIKSGWRGELNGFVENTDTNIRVSHVNLKLDYNTAWAICNCLTDNQIKGNTNLEKEQREALSQVGSALGRIIDHPSANNGGKKIIK